MKFKTVKQLLNDGWKLTTFYSGSTDYTRVAVYNDSRLYPFYTKGDKSVDECKEMLKDQLVVVDD